MKEIINSENPTEKTRKEAAEIVHETVARLRDEGFDIKIEEEPDTFTLEIKEENGETRKLGFMKALDFPNGKLEEVIEERIKNPES